MPEPPLILLIEDDDDLRDTLATGLRNAGYAVEARADGVDILDHVRRLRPATIVTDIIMPNREGIEVIQELRAKAPEVPVVAISGGGRIDASDILRFARAFGVRQTLAKPFRLKELTDAVEAALGG